MSYDAEEIRKQLILEEIKKRGIEIPETPQQKWRRNNPESYKKMMEKQSRRRRSKKGKLRVREYNVEHKYNLTPEGYKELLTLQNNACALCFTPFTEEIKPVIDHDHETDIVRGLLCKACNLRLCGVDEIEWLERAIDYVLSYGLSPRMQHKQLLMKGGPLRGNEKETRQEEGR